MAARGVCAVCLCVLALGATTGAADVVDIAARYLGRPYVWGAEGPNSFDCSGLTQFAFREVGINLPRRAISQSSVGSPVGSWRRGDLVFFRDSPNAARTVTHVGIYEGNGMMINASGRKGRVARESIHHPYWSQRLLFGRRVLGAGDIAREERTIPRRGGETARRPSDEWKRGAARAAELMAHELFRRIIRPPR